MFDIKEWPVQKSRGVKSLFRGLTPSFQVIFRVICFFRTNEREIMLREITDCKSSETSQEIFYDEVFFNKVSSIQCSDCNCALKITHNRFFLEYLPKTSCLKKNKKRKSLFWEKGLWWTSVSIKLQPCSTQPSVLSKKQNSCKTFL